MSVEIHTRDLSVKQRDGRTEVFTYGSADAHMLRVTESSSDHDMMSVHIGTTVLFITRHQAREIARELSADEQGAAHESETVPAS